MKSRVLTAAAIAAALLAVVLGSASQAFAQSAQGLVGKKVAGVTPVYVNGIKSSVDAIIIDQTSYIPVRASSVLFGYDVDYDAKNRRILLTKRPEPKPAESPNPSGQPPQNANQPPIQNASPSPQPNPGQGSQTGTQTDGTTGGSDSTFPGYYTITEEDIRAELEFLDRMADMYDRIIRSLQDSATQGYSQQLSDLLMGYYTKKSYVETEKALLKQLLDTRSRYRLFD